MSSKFLLSSIASLMLAVASPAWGQIKRAQPWHYPDGSEQGGSRVLNCPVPLSAVPPIVGHIALDDFQCELTGPITWVKWAGVLPNGAAQRFRRFYIRIWNHVTTACTPCGAPGTPLASGWCIVPHSRVIGVDCLGRQVYGFYAPLSPPFTQTAGQHYWLQISEIESGESITADVDFEWATYHPTSVLPLCPAMWISAGGGPSCGLGADCAPHVPPPFPDLAFRLGTTLVAGAILAPTLPLPPPTAFLAEFRTSAGGEVVYTELVEPAEDGVYMIDPGIPDGTYLMTLRGMGMGAQTRTITLQGGVAMGADFGITKRGDLNNDAIVDGFDIPLIVSGLLAP